MEQTIFGSMIGCIIALAIWKGTRESWFFSLCAWLVIVATVGLMESVHFPLDLLVLAGGIAVLIVGKLAYVDRLVKKKADI
jgi:hypothetical protein